MCYSHYRPASKQANVTVSDALAALSPTDSALKDYALYAGGGGLAGAGIGALVNALRGESKLKGALVGGGLGAGAGAGVKALGDYALSDSAKNIESTQAKLDALRAEYPRRMGDGGIAKTLHVLDSLTGLSTAPTPNELESVYARGISSAKNQDLIEALKNWLKQRG